MNLHTPYLRLSSRMTLSQLSDLAKKYSTTSLSVAEHVQAVISTCAQTSYAFRILRAHGMDDSGLQTVYRSVVISKLT